jgi:hypothetical protein
MIKNLVIVFDVNGFIASGNCDLNQERKPLMPDRAVGVGRMNTRRGAKKAWHEGIKERSDSGGANVDRSIMFARDFRERRVQEVGFLLCR